MFGKEISMSKGTTSIIARDLFIKGTLSCEGILEIEGRVEGDINGNIVTMRETATIRGNIFAKVLNIKGKFNGIIKSERINISGKADIKGTLEYMSLCVEDGASIEGDLKRVGEIKAVKEIKSITEDNSKNDSKK